MPCRVCQPGRIQCMVQSNHAQNVGCRDKPKPSSGRDALGRPTAPASSSQTTSARTCKTNFDSTIYNFVSTQSHPKVVPTHPRSEHTDRYLLTDAGLPLKTDVRPPLQPPGDREHSSARMVDPAPPMARSNG